jgi:hypothetical protein
MNRPLLVLICVCAYATAFAQESSDWNKYSSSDQLEISVRYSDCHFAEKGINNRYLLFKLENKSTTEMKVGYDLTRSYNGNKLNPDVNGFNFVVPANASIEGSCENLEDGLHLFVKTLDVEARSVLSDFRFSELIINGKRFEP